MNFIYSVVKTQEKRHAVACLFYYINTAVGCASGSQKFLLCSEKVSEHSEEQVGKAAGKVQFKKMDIREKRKAKCAKPLFHQQLSAAGTPVQLTRTEYAILKLLMQNPGQVLAKSVLLERIGADTPDCTESSLKTHISNLRGKLRSASGRST